MINLANKNYQNNKKLKTSTNNKVIFLKKDLGLNHPLIR